MYDVVVYLSSLPRIADRNRKVEVLQAFANGCNLLGLKTLLQTQTQVVPAKLGVILGWVGQSIRGPHIQLRKDVIDRLDRIRDDMDKMKRDNEAKLEKGLSFASVDWSLIFFWYSIFWKS